MRGRANSQLPCETVSGKEVGVTQEPGPASGPALPTRAIGPWHSKVSVLCETVPPAGAAAEGKCMDVLHVDCDTCVARGVACGDCVVMVLLGTPGGVVDLDPDEQAALQALAGSGLVPPLRLIPGARQVRDVQSPQDWRDYA
jgi:hypothetical protein